MQQKKNNNKLHKRVHWRRVKTILRSITAIENINSDLYNFSNICCYSCAGIELQGKNVKFKTLGKKSCWVDDNKYQVFEVPLLENKYPSYGKFLFLAKNISFNYWVLCESRVSLIYNKTKGSTSTYERIYFTPYGAYSLGNEDSPESIKKTVYGKNLTYGGSNSNNVLFDSCNNRKKAYSAMESRTIDQVNRTKNAFKKSVNSKSNVKIYKIKNNKNTNN